MSWALGEAPIRTAMTYIASNAAAKCAAVQARYSDSVTLPTFAARRVADPNASIEPEFPVLYAVPTRALPQPGPGGLARGFLLDGEVVFVVVFEATVDQTGSGTTPGETLASMGLRYGVVVLELLADSIASTGIEWGTASPIELTYGAQFTIRNRASRLSDVQVRIGYQTRESAL